MATFNSGVPQGDLKDKWTQYKDSINLVNPANKRNIDVIVVEFWLDFLHQKNLEFFQAKAAGVMKQLLSVINYKFN